MVSTVVIVGAHNGDDSLPTAKRYPSLRFVAIEPTPDVAAELRRRSAQLDNYVVVESAVALDEGNLQLNVFADFSELNSLNDINPLTAPAYGLPSPDPDRRQLVVAKRLSTICSELDIPTVEVLQIDTQGSDLDVLRSLDETRLRTVRAGMIEVSYRHRLYEASESGPQARSALDEMGFRISRIERIHHTYVGEHNYYFVARSRFRTRRTPIIEQSTFRSHLVACEMRAALTGLTAHPARRARNALALRSRLRRLLRADGTR